MQRINYFNRFWRQAPIRSEVCWRYGNRWIKRQPVWSRIKPARGPTRRSTTFLFSAGYNFRRLSPTYRSYRATSIGLWRSYFRSAVRSRRKSVANECRVSAGVILKQFTRYKNLVIYFILLLTQIQEIRLNMNAQ